MNQQHDDEGVNVPATVRTQSDGVNVPDHSSLFAAVVHWPLTYMSCTMKLSGLKWSHCHHHTSQSFIGYSRFENTLRQY